jgi:hypothetical protein
VPPALRCAVASVALPGRADVTFTFIINKDYYRDFWKNEYYLD